MFARSSEIKVACVISEVNVQEITIPNIYINKHANLSYFF